MNTLPSSVCTGCGHVQLSEPLILESQPIILNYRFPSPERACHVPRRDMEIRQCLSCGLIFNTTVDLSIIPYDERYENSQSASPIFLNFMQGTAEHLTKAYALHNGTVLEVGCGKGGFLRMICDTSGARGLGYDTSCEEDDGVEIGGVRFFRRYAEISDIPNGIDMIICRHVVEHIPQIGNFMRLLAEFSKQGGGSVVYIETPKWEWVVRNACFWDVFYEHCNYFPMPTLRYLAEMAGMEVLDHRDVFYGQYQALEVRWVKESAVLLPPGIQQGVALSDFSSSFKASKSRLRDRLTNAGAKSGWAVWGAGAKGVSLANALSTMPPHVVIDANPAKQGSFIPGTSIPVIAPDDTRLNDIQVVLIANPNYTEEITLTLKSLGLTPKIIQLS
jgi:SAM-dependent methyltransferase